MWGTIAAGITLSRMQIATTAYRFRAGAPENERSDGAGWGNLKSPGTRRFDRIFHATWGSVLGIVPNVR